MKTDAEIGAEVIDNMIKTSRARKLEAENRLKKVKEMVNDPVAYNQQELVYGASILYYDSQHNEALLLVERVTESVINGQGEITGIIAEALFLKGCIYFYGLNDHQNARAVFETARSYPSPFNREIEDNLRSIKSRESGKKYRAGNSDELELLVELIQ